MKKLKKSTQGAVIGGQNSTISKLLTKSKNSSKVPHCEDQRVVGQEIDANEEISELALEGGGSEFDDFDAFDEIQEFF